MLARRQFVTTAVGGVACASLVSSLDSTAAEDVPAGSAPKVVARKAGTQVWAMGVLVTVKVRGEDTGGSYSAFEDFIPPGAGPVPHTHTKEDETIFVLEGKLRAWLGGTQYDVAAGDFVHMPRGVEHYFKNVTDTPTRLLLTYTPGGFEQWFLDVGKPATADATTAPPITSNDIAQAVAAAQKYGVQFRKP